MQNRRMKHKRQGQGGKNCDENGSKSSSCGNEDEDSLDGLQGKQSQGRRRIKCESGGSGRRHRTQTKGSDPGSCGNEDEDSETDDGSDLKGGHVDDHDLDKLLPSPEDMDHSLSSKEDQQMSSVTAACPSLAAISQRLPHTPPQSAMPLESRIPTLQPPPPHHVTTMDDSAKHFYSRSAGNSSANFSTVTPAVTHRSYESSSTDFGCPFPQTRDYSHSSSSSSYTGGSYFSNDSQTYASAYPSATIASVSCGDAGSSNSSSSSSASPFQTGSVPGSFVHQNQHSYYDGADVQCRENLPPNVENEYTSGYSMSYSGSSSGHNGQHNPQSQRSYYENYSCQYREGQAGGGSSHFQRPMYTSDGYAEAHSTYSSSGYQQQHQSDHSLSHFSNQSSNASVPTNQSPIIDPYVQSNNYFEMLSTVNL